MSLSRLTVGLALLFSLSSTVLAGIVVYDEDDKKVEIGGRIQVQYARLDPDVGETTDRLFFRRLRAHLQATTTKNWIAKIQFDFGEGLDAEEVAIKDAYVRFTGLKNGQLTLGNQKPGFSRQALTSSKSQQFVSSGFAGDHNFGSPDRALVLKYDGHNGNKKFTYSAAGGAAQHDPDAQKMDFDTPANNRSDWNEGALLAGRVDFHPIGFMKFERGDFGRTEPRFNISLAGFYWSNDDDNNTLTDPGTGLSTSMEQADLDEAMGYEVSGGYRGSGWSVDGEYQLVSGDTVDPTFTGGIYLNGMTDLDILSFNGGYMLIDNRVEIAVGWDSIDADGYETAWTRTSLGLNLFVNRHKAKLQLSYQLGENVSGVRGDDLDTVRLQAQFVF